MLEKNEDFRALQKRKHAPLHEEQCDTPDKSGDTDSTVPAACGKRKLMRKVIKFKEEELDLQCEWWGCDYSTCNLNNFVHHVSLHR
jgi:hypothetical protein